MKTSIVALRCWFFAVLFNALMLVFVVFMSQHDGFFSEVLTAGLVLCVGSIVSAPLLLAVVPVLSTAKRLPYPEIAQIVWFASMLIVIGDSFVVAFLWLITGLRHIDREMLSVLFTIPVGIALSVLVNRKSFYKLSTYDRSLVQKSGLIVSAD